MFSQENQTWCNPQTWSDLTLFLSVRKILAPGEEENLELEEEDAAAGAGSTEAFPPRAPGTVAFSRTVYQTHLFTECVHYKISLSSFVEDLMLRSNTKMVKTDLWAEMKLINIRSSCVSAVLSSILAPFSSLFWFSAASSPAFTKVSD